MHRHLRFLYPPLLDEGGAISARESAFGVSLALPPPKAAIRAFVFSSFFIGDAPYS